MTDEYDKETAKLNEEYRTKFAKPLKEYETNELMKALTHARASLYYGLAKAFVDKYGDEAYDVLRQLRRSEGLEAGRAAAEEERERGKEPGLDTIREAYNKDLWWIKDMSWDIRTPDSWTRREACMMGKAFRELSPKFDPELKIARIFCSLDQWFAEGVSPNIKYTRPRWMPEGAPFCELCFTWVKPKVC